MPFVFFDAGAGSDKPFVAVDKFGRLMLSRAARELLGCVDIPAKFYVGYDKANKRIALAKPDVVKLPDTQPASFDKRGYARIKPFLRDMHIAHDETQRYYYVGMVDGAYAFALDGYSAPDDFATTKPKRAKS